LSDLVGSFINSNSRTGTICQDKPYLSFNQPQTTS
jgi:hypothetical protein